MKHVLSGFGVAVSAGCGHWREKFAIAHPLVTFHIYQ